MKELIHIHIPKSGGTWLTNTLKEHASGYFLETPAWHPLRLSNEVHHNWRDSVWVNPTAQAHYDNVEQQLELVQRETTHTVRRFDNATKISVCRNPFDWLVSAYHYQPKDKGSLRLRKYVPGGGPTGWGNLNAHHGIATFEDYIKKFCDPGIQWAHQNSETRYNLFYQMFLDDGRCGVDVIMRNESLKIATEKFLKGEGYADQNADITGRPHVGVGQAGKQRDYRSYYTDELRELIEMKCLAELTLFEYNFDGPTGENMFINPLSLTYHPTANIACKNLKEEKIKEWQDFLSGQSNNSDGIQSIRHAQTIWASVYSPELDSVGIHRYNNTMLAWDWYPEKRG